jgi:DNA-binding MarR family transcriptional regulator
MDKNAAKSIIEYNRILNLLFNDFFSHRHLEKFKPISLTQNQFSILRILKSSGPLLVSEIADIMQFSCAAASKNIDALVHNKLVNRRGLTKDRRKARISILDEGKKIVDDFVKECKNIEKEALASLSNNEQKELSDLLEKYVLQFLEEEENIEAICSRCQWCSEDDCILRIHDIKCRKP